MLSGCGKRDTTTSHFKRADDLLKHHYYQKARQQINLAIASDQYNLTNYRTGIALYYSHNQYLDSADLGEKALNLAKADKLKCSISDQEILDLYINVAMSYQKAHLLKNAENAYKSALALAPDDPEMLNCLGYFYAEENIKLDQSLRLLRRAVAYNPNNGNIVDSLGWAQYKMGQYRASVHTLARAVKLNPVGPELRYHLGVAYSKLGNNDSARIELGKAIILDHNMTKASILLKSLQK